MSPTPLPRNGSGQASRQQPGFACTPRVGATGCTLDVESVPGVQLNGVAATDELATDLHRGRRVRELRAIAGQRLRRAGSASVGNEPGQSAAKHRPLPSSWPQHRYRLGCPRHHRPKRHRSSNHQSKSRPAAGRRTRARGGADRGAGGGTAFGRVNSGSGRRTDGRAERRTLSASRGGNPTHGRRPSPPAEEPSPPAEEPSPSPSAEPAHRLRNQPPSQHSRPRRSQPPFRLRLRSSNQPRCQPQHPPRSQQGASRQQRPARQQGQTQRQESMTRRLEGVWKGGHCANRFSRSRQEAA